MADDNISLNSVDPNRAKKYHEGWVHHQTVRQKDWTKYWVVLRGNMLFICTNQKTTNPNVHVGTLALGTETEVKNLPSESRRRGFKFELWTASSANDRTKKVNRFKFDKENERDLWKSYILGISTGFVPRDVHLLPGQLKDIVEAIGDFQNTPPPLPTLPRPRLVNPQHAQAANGNWSTRSGHSSDGSDASGSFRGHLTYKGDAPNIPPPEGGGTLNNINQLNRRQADLAIKALDTDVKHSRTPYATDDPYNRESSAVVWSEFSLGPPTMENKRVDANQNYTDKPDTGAQSDSSDDLDPNPQEGPIRPLLPPQFRLDKNPQKSPPSPPVTPSPPAPEAVPAASTFTPPQPPQFETTLPSSLSHYSSEDDTDYRSNAVYVAESPTADPDQTFAARSQQNPGMSLRAVYKAGPPPPSMTAPLPPPMPSTDDRRHSLQPPPKPPSDSSRHSSEDYNSANYVHHFYNDPRRNRDSPPVWFFENCSRETAESILTLGKQYGNVLIRESVTFKNTGSYVISMRREVSGGTQLNHYEIMKTQQGFKINVDNRHSAMGSLQDVIDFFVNQAGPGTSPMRTNDLRKIGLNMTSSGYRPTTGRSRHHHDDDSGFDDPFDASDGSYPSPNNRDRHSRTTSPRHHRRESPRRRYSPDRRRHSPPRHHHHTMASPRGYRDDRGDVRDIQTSPRKLQISGSLSPEMSSMAKEIEYDLRKTSAPAAPPPPPVGGPPPPPPPPPGPPTPFGQPATLSPATQPTRTIGSLRDQYKRGSSGYGADPDLNQTDEMNGSPVHHSPPPLPSGHPTMGRLNRYDANDEPVSPGPSWNTSARTYGRRESEPAVPTSFNTVPSPRPKPLLTKELSFEDELKKRLVVQREDVYSSGATVLKSNWH